MREVTGDLWRYGPAEALRAITTNPILKRSGEVVMGRGCAREARDRFPGLARAFAAHIRTQGNVPWIVPPALTPGVRLVTFPVKHHWADAADLALVRASAERLRTLLDTTGEPLVIVPRPGCGNGQLDWAGEVRPVLAPLWDDRFVVIDVGP